MGLLNIVKKVSKAVVPALAVGEIVKGVVDGDSIGKAVSKSTVGRFAKGFAGGMTDAVKGVVELGKALKENPAKTGAALLSAARNPDRDGQGHRP